MTKIEQSAEPMTTWIALAAAGTRAGAQFPIQCAETLGRFACWQAEWLAALALAASPRGTALAAPSMLAKGIADHAEAELAFLKNGPRDEVHIID